MIRLIEKVPSCLKKKKVSFITPSFTLLSGQRDSNPRPPAPKAGALTGLRYTPNALFLKSECKGRKYFVISKEN